ncbi:MAG: serine/threonine-protein phosphatase, partial [Lachnospiraceae bacterium]|nr:serine/threonine-protein phosphatase [Lachnospiraceae bacterium]
LKGYITEAKNKMKQDLEVAKNIQASMLPSVFPYFVRGKTFDIFSSMDPAKEVGGDFYDFFMIGRNHFAFLVADVSGKGIPAAMFMMTAKTQIKSLAQQGLSPAEIMTEANNRLCETNEAGMFVTVWMGILDIETGIVTYVNAGHNPPVLRHNGAYDYFRTRPGLVLAGMEGVKYKQGEFQLTKDDIFFLYTDGVTEATNIHNELFGEDRLLEVLNALYDEPVEEIGHIVKRVVLDFTGEAPQFDDITMMVIRYKADKNSGDRKDPMTKGTV